MGKKITIAILLSLLVPAGILGYIYFYNSSNNSPACVDWNRYYSNYKDAIKDADLVVVGKVVSTNQAPQKIGTSPIAYTKSNIVVSEVFKNKNKDKNMGMNEIVIEQLGGTLNGVNRTPAEVALLQEGKEYVLILQSHENGEYGPISGWQGNILLENNKGQKLNRKLASEDPVESPFIGKNKMEIREVILKELN